MPIARGIKNRQSIVLAHRMERWEYRLDLLISGQGKPADVTLAWNKVKQVKGK